MLPGYRTPVRARLKLVWRIISSTSLHIGRLFVPSQNLQRTKGVGGHTFDAADRRSRSSGPTQYGLSICQHPRDLTLSERRMRDKYAGWLLSLVIASALAGLCPACAVTQHSWLSWPTLCKVRTPKLGPIAAHSGIVEFARLVSG